MQEPATQRARSATRRYAVVVWWGTAVEIHSAISRSLHSGSIDGKESKRAVTSLNRVRSTWTEILPSDSLRDFACDLLDRFPLRAADSLQLAAALTWSRQRPDGKTIICGDKRLNEAAKAIGFSIVEI
jgi:predicted nucleic acid-binding protein